MIHARAAALFSIVLLLAASATTARADPNRFAVIIGANAGDPDEVILRYAESDAERVGSVLRTLGGFQPENVITLENLRAGEVRRALIALNARVRELSGESLMIVYYSGHADADALHLDGTRLPMNELRDLVSGSAASARILVLDACRSGTITRVKGGTRGPAFEIDVGFPVGARGVAMLSSSAAGESSQESDALGASFFTHALVSALIGAGDSNHDGAVTLGEAFAYAKERTLAATARTVVGPQHPTFRLDLGGREDLVLTRPGAEHRNVGLLAFARPGLYVVQKSSAEGPVVAELMSDDAGGRLAVDPGRYFVTRRDSDHLEQGRFDVTSRQTTMVAQTAMARLEYARVVRKGGTPRRLSGSLFADGGVRGQVFGLGTAWRTELGGRLDLRQFSLALRLGFSQSDHDNGSLDITTREVSTAIDALRAFDLGPVTLDVGLELGASWFLQAFHDPSTRDSRSFGPFVGAVGQVEVPLPHHLYARLEVAGLFYFLRTSEASMTATAATYRAAAGVGVSF
ncbi:MAG: peptidase caspase catalytic subunit p20 [Myxococcales bacterium]|nr:peptidase caspase catalytic subunit p20 [Myxococcales bacterium]